MSAPQALLHVAPDLGLPYAAAGVDAEGYHVTCPVCGWVARAEGGRTEDEATKGASLAYAGHFAAEERAGR